MSAPDILAKMTSGWNRDPAGVALGTERTGVSAALWTHGTSDCDDVAADQSFDEHIVSVQQLGYRAEVFKDGQHCFTRHLERGTTQLMQAGVRPRAVQHGRWQVLHLYLPANIITSATQFWSTPSSLELIDPAGARDLAIERIGREVLDEMQGGEHLSRLRIDVLGQDLAIQLLRRWSNLAGTRALTCGPARGGLAPWQVRRTTEFLAENLAEEVGLETLAALAQLSTFHFARAFKQSTGLPPHRYQLRLRLERAQALLAGTDLPVTEIAAMVGYDAPQTLARLFRRELGVSPTEYRREWRR
jgi:AraC family transcriptional regulator